MPEVSDDGLVYTFTLKPGAMFAGPDFEPREVTAADVAYGMTRALDPTPDGAPAPRGAAATSSPSRAPPRSTPARPSSVEGIKVIDDHTLQVTLEAADQRPSCWA